MKFADPPTQVPAQAKRYPSVKALLKDRNVRRYLKKLSAQYRYPDAILPELHNILHAFGRSVSIEADFALDTDSGGLIVTRRNSESVGGWVNLPIYGHLALVHAIADGSFVLNSAPPRSAYFLLLLIPKRNREHLIGDLEEEYRTIVLPKYGERAAWFWYWWQVGISFSPLLWARLKQLAGFVILWKNVH
jgi:hypothetical protein